MMRFDNKFRGVGIITMVLLLAGGSLVWVFRGGVRISHVVLISIDTCRPDHLSCYGYSRNTTPNIDALAKDGVLFENVIAPVPNTLPSHSSMMTGTLPPYHGVHSNIAYRLRDSNITLAEILKEHGFTTGAAVATFVLDRQFGLAQGFDVYDDDIDRGHPPQGLVDILSERKASAINRFGLPWLREHQDQPFFLFLHYYDAHVPYQPPEPFASRWANAPYDGEIAYVDQAVGQVIDQLKTLGLYDSTLIIVTSDHGEGLGDHGEAEHGYFIYHNTTKVPLIIRWPGQQGALRVVDKVALTDVAPTILTALGISPPDEMKGIDLDQYTHRNDGQGRGRLRGRAFYSESLAATLFGCSSLLAIETQRWKYIQSVKPELYDLQNDPAELINVLQDHPTEARRLRERLRALLDENTRIMDDSHLSLDAESLARLESLGYVGGRVSETILFDTTGHDPKEFYEYYEKLSTANRLVHLGKFERVQELCLEILAKRSDIGRAYELLGRVAYETDQFSEAVDYFQQLLALDSSHAEGHNALGNALIKLRRWDEALARYRKAIELVERIDQGEETMDRALRRLGRIDPVAFEARKNLANVLFFLQRYDEAIKEFRLLLTMETLSGNRAMISNIRAQAYHQLGISFMKLGRADEASNAFESALKLQPNLQPARDALQALQSLEDQP